MTGPCGPMRMLFRSGRFGLGGISRLRRSIPELRCLGRSMPIRFWWIRRRRIRRFIRAAQRKTQMMLSTNASLHIREVAPSFGGPLWYQLYSQAEFEVSKALVGAAEQAGCTVLAVTADSAATSNRLTARRAGVQTEQRC